MNTGKLMKRREKLRNGEDNDQEEETVEQTFLFYERSE